jgi:hypothetical protein
MKMLGELQLGKELVVSSSHYYPDRFPNNNRLPDTDLAGRREHTQLAEMLEKSMEVVDIHY